MSTKCIFCNAGSFPEFEETLSHMRKKHGLFIPDSLDGGSQVLCIDLEAMVKYLHMVIFQDHECVSCHRQKKSLEAIQHHMLAKSHCYIDLDSEDSEYRDFYEPNPAVISVSQKLLLIRMAEKDNSMTGPTYLPKRYHKKRLNRKPIPAKPRVRTCPNDFFKVRQAKESDTAVTTPRVLSRLEMGRPSGLLCALMKLTDHDREMFAHLTFREQISKVSSIFCVSFVELLLHVSLVFFTSLCCMCRWLF